MNYTVLGATGFIGSHVADLARKQGHHVYCPGRDEVLDGQSLGHVIYAIGITADFRRLPHETITAHVTKLQDILRKTSFESLVYLSSTRVYARCLGGMDLSDRPGRSLPVSESTLIPVQSSDFSDLYNLSKLMGESIGLAHGKSVRVARLSNVVGPDFDSENFLISVLKDCILKGHVTLRTSLQSGKDYISIVDVSSALLQIGPSGKSPIYNIASGKQTTNAELVRTLTELTGATFSVAENSPTIRFPAIDNGLAARELGLAPVDFQSLLPALVQQYHELRDNSLKINQTDRTGLLRRSA